MNEEYAGDPLWQKVNPDKLGTEAAGLSSAWNSSGTIFQSVRQMFLFSRSWFYHEEQDPKSRGVGRNLLSQVGQGTPLL